MRQASSQFGRSIHLGLDGHRPAAAQSVIVKSLLSVRILVSSLRIVCSAIRSAEPSSLQHLVNRMSVTDIKEKPVTFVSQALASGR